MLVLGLAVAATPAAGQSHDQYDAAGGGSSAPQGGSEATASQTVDPEQSGGAEFGATSGTRTSTAKYPVVPGVKAKLLRNGKAAAPAQAPAEVQRAVWAANRIVGKPYRYGGGHARWKDTGYDCSGTVSFALRGGSKRWLKAPLDSGSFMGWSAKGPGSWITVYTNPGHAYVVIAGLRLDTSAAGDPSGRKGPRWRPTLRETRGYVARHPAGF